LVHDITSDKDDSVLPSTITWGKRLLRGHGRKYSSRAEELSMTLNKVIGKDRVALNRKSKRMDFIIALYSCFIAGKVAVPINAAEQFEELTYILDNNLKVFVRDLAAQKKEYLVVSNG